MQFDAFHKILQDHPTPGLDYWRHEGHIDHPQAVKPNTENLDPRAWNIPKPEELFGKSAVEAVILHFPNRHPQ